MSFPKFVPIITENKDVNKLQKNIELTLTPIVANTTLDSKVLTGQSLSSAGINIINHGLGRALTGWHIIRKRGYADVWDLQDSNLIPNLTLYLLASNSVVVDLLVF